MNYKDWDYSLTVFLDATTRANMSKFFRNASHEEASEYIYWLKDHHTDFFNNPSSSRVIVLQLMISKHFKLAQEIFDNEHYIFNERISNVCSYAIHLDFNEDTFNFWHQNVQKMPQLDVVTCLKQFWPDFFDGVFLKDSEVREGLDNLEIVFQKKFFYINTKYELTNGSLMKARKKFYETDIFRLSPDFQFLVLEKTAMLCAKYHPDSKKFFIEEFEHFKIYPSLLSIFEKTILNDKLTDSLVNKVTNVSPKAKI